MDKGAWYLPYKSQIKNPLFLLLLLWAVGVTDFDETWHASFVYCGKCRYVLNLKTFGWIGKILSEKIDLDCMGGGRRSWPILLKLGMHLCFILKSVCTKFGDFCLDRKNFTRKNRFGLYERWAVGVVDFDEIQVFS